MEHDGKPAAEPAVVAVRDRVNDKLECAHGQSYTRDAEPTKFIPEPATVAVAVAEPVATFVAVAVAVAVAAAVATVDGEPRARPSANSPRRNSPPPLLAGESGRSPQPRARAT